MSVPPDEKPAEENSRQDQVIAFLSSGGGAFEAGAIVERHDTHGAIVFLAGDSALKIKRDVRFAYMDFSTLEKRHAALVRELDVNRRNAPELYIDVVPVTRLADGTLLLDGDGEVIEWVLRMRRFRQSALLSRQLAHGLDVAGLKSVADEVLRSHRDAEIYRDTNPAAALKSIITEIADALGKEGNAFREAAIARLSAAGPVIERRAQAGFVRRCHGDLHLDNIVIISERPRLFDALEFDEALATIDTMYDLAFLLMDLDAKGFRGASNTVLNRYLWKSQDRLELEGLAALPVYLALRAGVRAMVTKQRATQSSGEARHAAYLESAHYLKLALSYLDPLPVVLVAVGGLSGTGKSTLAAGVAPMLGPSPGALHLRSDLERKALLGVDELTRLPDEAYSGESSARVYAVLVEKARSALTAGHSVIVDAVFSSAAERIAIARLAEECDVPFLGIWLQATSATLVDRVSARTGDASDATEAVVLQQVARGAGEIEWQVIDASGSVEQVRDRAVALLCERMPNFETE